MSLSATREARWKRDERTVRVERKGVRADQHQSDRSYSQSVKFGSGTRTWDEI